MQGIHAAAAVGVTGKDADGTGKAGSSAEGLPSLGPESLDTPSDSVSRSPDPKTALRPRKPGRPAQNPFLRPTEAAKQPDPQSEAARAERRDPTRQRDRDDGSKLRGREE